MKWKKGEYITTDDKSNVDVNYVHRTLNTTYWAAGRPKEIVKKSIENSVFLSVFKDGRQVGYSRVVSDNATFAWICDVYIDPEHRGSGLGKWLMRCTLKHPSAKVRINLLATKDAQGLYEKYGFERKECMARRGA